MAKRLPPRGPGGRFLPRARARRSNPPRRWQPRDGYGRLIIAGKRAVDLRRAYERAQRAERQGTKGATARRIALGKSWVRTRQYAHPTPAELDDLRDRELERAGFPKVYRKRNPGKKGKRTMARRTAAQKRATAKLIAFNKAKRRKKKGGGGRRARRRSSSGGIVNQILAAIKGRKAGRKLARRRKSNPSNGGTSMARRRKRRSGARRRSRRGAIMVISNPRRRRGRRRNPGGIRLRNPGGSMMSAGKEALGAMIPATVGAAAFSFAETKWLRGLNPVVRIGARLAGAAGSAMLLRKRPAMAYATMGAIIGGFGTEIGVRAAGGVVAAGGKQGMREIAAIASDDPEQLSALYDEMQGMGLLSQTGDDMPSLGDFAEVGAAGDDVPDLGDEAEDMGGDDDEFAEIGDDDDEIP